MWCMDTGTEVASEGRCGSTYLPAHQSGDRSLMLPVAPKPCPSPVDEAWEPLLCISLFCCCGIYTRTDNKQLKIYTQEVNHMLRLTNTCPQWKNSCHKTRDRISQTIRAMGYHEKTHPPHNIPVWPFKKPERRWHMPIDCSALNKATGPLTAPVPSIVDMNVIFWGWEC